MDKLQLTIGMSPPEKCPPRDYMRDTRDWLTAQANHRQYIHDVHFAHWNPMIASSGRLSNTFLPPDDLKDLQYYTIEWNAANTQLKLTLLLNYVLHDNYKLILLDFARNYYARGIRSVVVADLNLIKAIKDKFPDVQIQGSCLSYRLTEEELQEEADAGVSIHNPSVDIIRNSAQLKRNHLAGFKQKVIVAEGCLHQCPVEKPLYGHRWHTARVRSHLLGLRSLGHEESQAFLPGQLDHHCPPEATAAVHSLCEAAGGSTGTLPNSPGGIGQFIEVFYSGRTYNLIDYLAAAYVVPLRQVIGYIPSDYFGEEFFNTIETCGGQCATLRCACAGGS